MRSHCGYASLCMRFGSALQLQTLTNRPVSLPSLIVTGDDHELFGGQMCVFMKELTRCESYIILHSSPLVQCFGLANKN